MTYHQKYLSSSVLAITAFSTLLLCAPSLGLATPILGATLASYAVLGADAPGVSCVATCVIVGNVGSSPIGASPGSIATSFSFPSFGTFQPAATATEGTAQTDLTTAIGLVNANGPGITVTGGHLDTFFVGGVINPGTYTVPALAGGNITGNILLDGLGSNTAVWNFLFTSDLITSTGSNVSVIGVGDGAGVGVYWTVVSAATLNGNTFAGNVMAGTGISSDGDSDGVGPDSALTMGCGRLLTDTGPVTLIMDKISIGCAGFEKSGGFDQGNPSGGNGPPTNGVPEPATLLLLGSGLAGLAAWRRKQAA